MEFAGTQSWTITLDQWDERHEWALWVRAAERIPVEAGGAVTGPLDIDPLPASSVSSGESLTEGWLVWWHTVLGLQRILPEDVRGLTEPPGSSFGLETSPELRQVAQARWPEAREWHKARKRAGVEAIMRPNPRRISREGSAVLAVEAEIGCKAEPFALRIVVLPVIDDKIRGIGDHTFLVPERLHATDAYDHWLHRVVRALA